MNSAFLPNGMFVKLRLKRNENREITQIHLTAAPAPLFAYLIRRLYTPLGNFLAREVFHILIKLKDNSE
jgi:hypothetical protein